MAHGLFWGNPKEHVVVKKLYVGNLPYSTGEAELRELFEPFGTVHSANVIVDRETGRTKGFGFVELDDEPADNGREELNGNPFGGRNIRVDEAKPRENRRPQGGGGRW